MARHQVIIDSCPAGPACGVSGARAVAIRFEPSTAAGIEAPPVDPETPASRVLANLTAVISVGLLATSGLPTLYAVGQVMAPGILRSLIFAAAFIPARPRTA